ncbi:hypothetical protein S7711_09760 [Stachybotrys chartarum IBT 7711]|uniref:Chromo domain-containing protein n=1 Tax=Stachybotrys chartarum (strain CBS 109288 / IBT 7711) TaxID=1280523 RepID=A0A084B518_STACB|nr:hypothetical protein S7711_09760 [Stachybotrys chartarum IBT 7711]
MLMIPPSLSRSTVLKDPDMWHVLRVEKNRIIQGTNEIVLQVAWIGSTQRSWEPEAAIGGYAEEYMDEYWTKLGGRESVLTTAALRLPTGHTQSQKEMVRKRTKSAMSKAAETTSVRVTCSYHRADAGLNCIDAQRTELG